MIKQQNVEAVHTHTHTHGNFIEIKNGVKAFICDILGRLFYSIKIACLFVD